MEGALKPDVHAPKVALHAKDHTRHEEAKAERMERHSGDGHRLKEGPKKGGGGGHNWGNPLKDDPRQ
ncbi:hypothetical protein Rsub_12641 [Raphidocelis subcapitata]|uniref:Hyaluronan/mRNA-binding protein domain-containing protein n=1 Tax=Raphidocelis subcapitata TaxID=307507 RepID=A0A2V0PJI0_9CHLO|nr:hypothetical protein Rsub_12641 [Raphidocelis subcapitata]|eukprot:GBF99948.1 hypothetical protein Rsub_12641 [Raphidocelis subcapitata]